MKIGPINIEKPLALAPMEDVTDISFRRVCREMGADLVYTEFTSSEAIIRDVPKAMAKIAICEEERPVAIQIFGGAERSMEGAAAIAESLKPDFIDINCGCWVKNHALRGEGAGLLRDLPQFEKIVRATVNATKLPVTVKTRLGWDDKSIVILDVAKMVEQNGAKALTIHCRTRTQGYKGGAQWAWLEKIKKVISIPLIGNGDVMTPQDVKAMFDTGCDGVMIGRGAIANPFLFREAKHYLRTGGSLPPLASLEERAELCLRHLKLAIEVKGLRTGIAEFRKFYAGYFHGMRNAAQLRADMMAMNDLAPIANRLYQFLEESKDLAGSL